MTRAFDPETGSYDEEAGYQAAIEVALTLSTAGGNDREWSNFLSGVIAGMVADEFGPTTDPRSWGALSYGLANLVLLVATDLAVARAGRSDIGLEDVRQVLRDMAAS